LKSEWIKTRSLRSTWWCGLLLLGLSAVYTALLAASFSRSTGSVELSQMTAADGYLVDLVNNGLAVVGEVVALVFGSLMATTEYASGSIRSTLSAVPRRGLVIAGKSAVVALFMAVSAAVSLLVGVAISMAVLDTSAYSFGADAVKMACGIIAYIVLTGLVGLGIGFLLRSSAGAIAGGVGFYMVVPAVLMSLPHSELITSLVQLHPGYAGQLVYALSSTIVSEDGQPLLGGYWGGMACLVVWGAAAVAAGYAVFRKRDA
jgi:ABC-2 type transport system permease protein